MTKIEKINLEIKKLQKEKISMMREYDIAIKNKEMEKKTLYPNYFASFQKKDFVFVENFPDLEVLKAYYSSPYSDNSFHPIWEYGYFNIKELIEIIRLIYSLQNQKEYQILTVGYLKKEKIKEQLVTRKPYLQFTVGEQEQLKPYQLYQNCFIADDYVPIEYVKKANQISLFPKYALDDTLKIQCNCPKFLRNDPGINYCDWIEDEEIQCSVQYSDQINIFDKRVYQKFANYEGMNDTISFPIDKDDTFLAEILIGIAIYKKNRKVHDLTNDDYRYIFQKIFREYSVDVAKGVEKNIPKTLKYVK